MKRIFTIIALLIVIAPAKAQFVYTNEVCSNAIQLDVSNNSRFYDTLFLDNRFADVALSPVPYCNGATNVVRRDLWYTFTATDTALFLIAKVYPSDVTGVNLQLFTGDCNNLTSINCYSGKANRIGGLSIGQQYYLRSYHGNTLTSDFFGFSINIVSKPTNDDCTGAMLLPVLDANTSHSLGEHYIASLATAATTCNAPATGWPATLGDVWYKFIATATSHAVYIAGGASEAVVYREAAGVFTAIAGFDFFVSTEIETLTNLVPGNTYYIRVGSSGAADFTIGVFGNAPLNDDCANADTVLMSSSFACDNNFSISNRMVANTSAGGCTVSSMVKDVWFIFQATAAAVTIRATEGSSVRMGLSAGACGSLTCLTTNTSGEFTYSGLTIGNYYYLQVGGSGEERPVTICISPAITNDECDGAITIPVRPFGDTRHTIVYTRNATQSLPPCNGSGGTRDVWYRFTATDTAHMVTIDGANDFQVLSGTCGALNPLYCGGSVTQPLNSIERTEKVAGLVPGQLYYLRVWDSNLGDQYTFTIDVTQILPNDECAGAKLLIPQQSPAYEPMVNNGIYQSSQSLPPCSTATSVNDIWYKFVATASSAAIISNLPGHLSNINTLGLEVFSGSCGSLTSIACVQQGEGLAHKSQNLSNLVPGNTYYIRQYGNVINNTITVITPPANDDITGAVRLYPSPAAIQTQPSYFNYAAAKRFGRMCTNNSATMDHDVWFYFVAEATSHTFSTSNSNSFWPNESSDIYRLEAFRGFAADSLSLAGKLISCANSSIVFNGLTIGDTVYVRVGSFGAGLSNVFTVKVSSALSMDEPAGAAVLSKRNVYEYRINTTGATQSMPASCSITDFPDDDVWFKFTAAADVKRIVAGDETQNITLQLFSGTPGNLVPVLCSSNIMVLPSTLTNGSQYYLRAYTKVNTTRGEFTIGLFGEDDLYANSCNQSTATLGPNLVINPRFEMEEPYITPVIPNGYGYAGKRLAAGWWGASLATPDAWSANYPKDGLGNVPATSGYGQNKIPRSGQSMLGMLNTGGWHEYVTSKLAQPLKKGKTYFVSFYISFTELYPNEAFKIGALLSNDSIHNNLGTDALDITPQVGTVPGSRIDAKTKWYNVCGYMTADEAYSFITLGNFGNPVIYAGGAGNTYMFVDDVVVAEVIGQVVPLSLLDFHGRMNAQQQSELTWATAGETNTKQFEVEWRTDTKPFVKVGTVKAAGNSSVDKYYNFLHANTATGYNYYRLKMMDNDGRFTYSPIVRTGNTNKDANIIVYPNPVAASLNITASVEKDEMVFFKLVDSYGRTVATKQKFLQKGSTTFTWNMATLAAGNYFMVSTGSGHAVVKIVKR